MHVTGTFIALTLAFAELTNAQNLTAAELANLEHYWSYGRSEPSYPTPQSVGRSAWERAHARARALVATMTNDEKNNITYGTSQPCPRSASRLT